jgi:hypothetical protein
LAAPPFLQEHIMGFDPNQPGSMPNFGSYLGQGQNFSEMILDQLPGGGRKGVLMQTLIMQGHLTESNSTL